MSTRTVYLETFGCQMNELDSELVAGQLRTLGYRFVQSASDANVVLYNTCSVREHAEQKVWSRLGELKDRKLTDPNLIVGVLGCMAERDGTDLIKRMPVVDVLVGPAELDKLPGLLDNALRTRESLQAEPLVDINTNKPVMISANQVALQGSASRRSATLAAAGDSLELLDLSRSISPLDDDGPVSRSAYVRITRGCNKFCTYCVVPFTRGAEVHRPPDHIIDECKKLADAGAIEITLLGQTVNHYRFEHGAAVTIDGLTQPQKGRSFTGGHRRDPLAGANVTTFADLLRRIHDEVPAIKRLRFVTSYPRDFGDDVLEVIRHHPRICRYLHVPAQSGSDRLLKLMNRGYTVAEYLEFLDRTREYLDQPEIGRPLMLSGDFITGFPTETDEDFNLTKQFLVRCRYKNAFIFKYSPRPGTIAFDKLADDIPEHTKRARNNELLALQNQIADDISREQIGRTFDVLVEGLSRQTLKKQGKTSGDLRKAGQVTITIGGRNLAPDDRNDQSNQNDQPAACSTTATSVLEVPANNTAEKLQLACRTDGDLIVFIDHPAATANSLIGQILKARITTANMLSLQGELVEEVLKK
ncbi:tRNA-2-methylthio-N(6)-dimethylallyladenosine synthase [Phycisphaerae bacterium]|jgi:tRNA-2-methylthio-N6-dimethylallyladenosine synthase|nr:tRNA-2-methylthio-N(6)-dimethylallyladenosine synthase [Phycisphaerae bacterium]